MQGTYVSAVFVAALCLTSFCAEAQELEPRAYSPSPVGTNFLGLGYSYSAGDVSIDPSVPITDVEAKIHSVVPAYARTFDVFGRLASVAALVPFVDANVSGMVGNEPGEVTRTGIGDARFRVTSNIIGGEALSPKDFAQYHPSTVVGTSFVMVVPTGEYTSERLINIGSNRWAFKAELGGSQLFDSWFVDASIGEWFFTDNQKFFGDQRKSQDPITSFQAHCGYTFSPGLWLAGDATYYTGGETTVGGVEKNDSQSNSRYGLTFSVPLSESFALKLSWSNGYTTRIGGDFSTVAATLQYRWFDSEGL